MRRVTTKTPEMSKLLDGLFFPVIDLAIKDCPFQQDTAATEDALRDFHERHLQTLLTLEYIARCDDKLTLTEAQKNLLTYLSARLLS